MGAAFLFPSAWVLSVCLSSEAAYIPIQGTRIAKGASFYRGSLAMRDGEGGSNTETAHVSLTLAGTSATMPNQRRG